MSSGRRRVAAARSEAKDAPCCRKVSMISAVAPTVGSTGGAAGPGRIQQPPQIGAEHHSDGRRLRRRRRSGPSASVRGRGASRSHATSPSWHSLSSQPGLVVAQAAGEQLRLPRHRGGLEALQLLDHRRQAGVAGELGAGRDVLPAQQEPHEVLGGGGLDGLAPGAPGVAVHPGQQPAGHPLGARWRRAGTGPARRSPPAAAAARATADPAGRQGRRVGQRVGRGDAARAPDGPAPGGPRRASSSRRERSRASAADSVVHHSSTPSRTDGLAPAPLRPARPTAAATQVAAGVATRDDEQVVQVVGGGRVGRDLGVHLLDGLGVEGADRGQVDVEASAQAARRWSAGSGTPRRRGRRTAGR